MKREDMVDFFVVEPGQVSIHERLCNWAVWCRGSAGATVAPMFRLYRTPARGRDAYGGTTRLSTDTHDALKIHAAIKTLAERNRASLNWYYLKPVNPRRAADEIGTTVDGLALLVRDSRELLLRGKP